MPLECPRKGEMSIKGTKILHTKWGDIIIRSQKEKPRGAGIMNTTWSDASSIPTTSEILQGSYLSLRFVGGTIT